MEGLSANAYKGIKGYWKRRGYEKLNGSGGRRKRRVEFAANNSADGSNRKRRSSWRIKLTPRVKLKLKFSPKKFLIKIRDGYINFMNRMASSKVMISSGVGGGYGGGAAVSGFGARPLKEYDEKMIVEIYKSLVIAQGQLLPRDAAKIGTQMICQR